MGDDPAGVWGESRMVIAYGSLSLRVGLADIRPSLSYSSRVGRMHAQRYCLDMPMHSCKSYGGGSARQPELLSFMPPRVLATLTTPCSINELRPYSILCHSTFTVALHSPLVDRARLWKRRMRRALTGQGPKSLRSRRRYHSPATAQSVPTVPQALAPCAW